MSILNAKLIHERRLANGLSPRDLAKDLNVSTVAIRSLEQGTNHSHLTLHRAELLASALGLPLVDIVNRTPAAEREPAADDLKVEAALAAIGGKLHPNMIAEAFGWTLERTIAALSSLRERRAATAIPVHITGGRYHAVPRRTLLAEDELQTLARAAATTRRISTLEGELLKRAIDEYPQGWDGDISGARRPTLAHLINLGWLEHRDGRYLPSEEVLTSLALTATPTENRTGTRKRKAKHREEPVPAAAGAA